MNDEKIKLEKLKEKVALYNDIIMSFKPQLSTNWVKANIIYEVNKNI